MFSLLSESLESSENQVSTLRDSMGFVQMYNILSYCRQNKSKSVQLNYYC